MTSPSHTIAYIADTSPPELASVQWIVHRPLSGLIDHIVRTQPALIVLFLPHTQWHPFAHGLKSSSATRRIPLVLIHEDAGDASVHGVDAVVDPQQWLADPAQVINQYAARIDAAIVEALACQCDQPLPPRAIEGIQRFNQGEYYQQHDLFEAQWMEETGPVRDLYRAILQVGVGYYQITRGNYRGALKMLQKSVQWLTLLPDECQGVNVRQLREDSFRVRAELERAGETGIHQFDHTLLKPVQWANDTNN